VDERVGEVQRLWIGHRLSLFLNGQSPYDVVARRPDTFRGRFVVLVAGADLVADAEQHGPVDADSTGVDSLGVGVDFPARERRGGVEVNPASSGSTPPADLEMSLLARTFTRSACGCELYGVDGGGAEVSDVGGGPGSVVGAGSVVGGAVVTVAVASGVPGGC
jgi:hypothetical protein